MNFIALFCTALIVGGGIGIAVWGVCAEAEARSRRRVQQALLDYYTSRRDGGGTS